MSTTITQENNLSIVDAKKNQYGLVLSGGAGKGSYEVGVWKALNEIGIADKVTGFSGTSVGALNTALFVSNMSIDEIVEIWHDYGPIIDTEDVINLGTKIVKLTLKLASNNYIDAAGEALSITSIASQEKIKEILSQIDLTGTSNKTIYSCVTDHTLISRKKAYISWTLRSKEQIGKIIRSSSGIPILYPPHPGERSGHVMFDGGLKGGDNTPIAPLWYEGYRNIIVVYLENNEKSIEKKIEKENRLFPGTNIIRIIPSNAFHKGGKAFLNTDIRRIEDNIELGKHDTITKVKLFELKDIKATVNQTLYNQISRRIERGDKLVPRLF